MRSGVLDVEEQTPVYLFGIAGLIEHLVLPHLENAAACATNFAARGPSSDSGSACTTCRAPTVRQTLLHILKPRREARRCSRAVSAAPGAAEIDGVPCVIL